MDSAGDLDQISALPDAVLHRILACVRDATTVTRTAALSRRWRRVWVRAPCLTLWDTTDHGEAQRRRTGGWLRGLHGLGAGAAR
ncbi:hypothetical protein BAE44_0014685 [Dichanthelium oligosanthes]|uniref:F-box domain-containing protein n=1 Tax=Dichanthelium oligosanthes TaxID=888268 RepID=A0A1E5VGP8_9POAL|nr:hypothetical protein BAE44_0014685 [Dichanthelium oligosanthes]